jgi:Inner membrane protein YgaP-like, transmembrane domain
MTFTNEGTWDRVIRIVLAFALGYAAWVSLPATIGIVTLVIGAIALITGLVGWCPAYALFGISTRKKVAA